MHEPGWPELGTVPNSARAWLMRRAAMHEPGWPELGTVPNSGHRNSGRRSGGGGHVDGLHVGSALARDGGGAAEACVRLVS